MKFKVEIKPVWMPHCGGWTAQAYTRFKDLTFKVGFYDSSALAVKEMQQKLKNSGFPIKDIGIGETEIINPFLKDV